MKLHLSLLFGLSLLAAGHLQAEQQAELPAEQQRLNVLMIIVDDLAPVISPYGGPVVTPALDQLAARGVRFTHNYANVPVCGASRASMLSGLAPDATRFLSYDSRLDQDVENAVSLPAYFQQHGWHTQANGKVFDVLADSAEGWTEPVWSPDDQWHGKVPDGRGEHLQSAYIEPFSGRRAPYFERLEVADTDYPDGQVAVKSVADLHRLAGGDTPFFLAVGFRKPHLPFNAPERYWRADGSEADLLPDSWYRPATGITDYALHRSPELRAQYDALPLLGDPSDAVAVEIVNAYHAAVRYADAQVAQVLSGLAASGAAENTLVVLMGDHGFLLGEQRMWTKHALFEPALRTPLIITHPGIAGGHEVRAVTDLLDVFPTLVDLTDLPLPDHLDGTSLRPLLEQPTLTERQDKPVSVSRWMNGESVRNQQFRYTRWFDESGQTLDAMLFDLSADPNEQTNLVNQPQYASVISELETYLNQQRSDSFWSEQLEEQYSRWLLAASVVGSAMLVVMLYPLPLVVGLLLLLAVGAYLLFRRRKRQS
ncbi:MAG: sulfatase [Pseudomonadales bacterium]